MNFFKKKKKKKQQLSSPPRPRKCQNPFKQSKTRKISPASSSSLPLLSCLGREGSGQKPRLPSRKRRLEPAEVRKPEEEACLFLSFSPKQPARSPSEPEGGEDLLWMDFWIIPMQRTFKLLKWDLRGRLEVTGGHIQSPKNKRKSHRTYEISEAGRISPTEQVWMDSR